MQVEISRRKFLQGTVALSVIASSSAICKDTSKQDKMSLGTTKTSNNKDVKLIPTLCEMCVNKCAAYARVENNIVTKLEPNPHFPKSQNMLCARGNAGIQALYDPDRLKYPLIRIGKRGDGKYKRVTWDEAYSYISEKMTKIIDEEKDNRSCFGYCAGEGLAEHTFKTFMSNKIGSSNFVNHASICLQTAVSGYALTIGKYGQADLQNAKYVIMAGANRAEAILTPDTMDIFKRTRGRGTKLVVVDPRFTNTAIHADNYLAIQSGTDLAFVLALTYHVIKNELYNRTYVKNNFSNFDKYKEHVLNSEYTPKWAEKITGIPASEIEQVAQEFMANAPQAIYYQGRRSTWTKNDFQLRRAQAIFTALGGGIDIKGGIVFGKKLPLGSHYVNAPLYSNPKARIEKDEAAIIGGSGSWIAWRNMIVEERTPYPIRGMFVYKQNPVLSVPNTKKTKEMFEKMDLVVVIDTMPSDTAIMADVILPECTYLEREDPVKSFPGVEPSIALRKKVINPMYETKPVIEIIHGLAKKLSKPLFEISKKYDEDLQDELEGLSKEEIEELYEDNGYNLADAFEHSQEHVNKEMFLSKYNQEAWEILNTKGVFYPKMLSSFEKIDNNSFRYYKEKDKFFTVVKLENKEDSDDIDTCINPRDIAEIKRLFSTPSKKIECYLENLTKKGIEPMPVWHQEDFKEIPKGKFKFITGRHAQFTQNSTANNVMLLELMPENYVWINEKDAKKKGIKHADLVEIKSSVGTIQIKAFPTDKIVANTVFYIHGFGSNSSGMTFANRNGASDNEIIEDEIEPVFGSAIMHETIVSIRKV
jgi:thiosulfate reductase/polysulfide reductase chain A